MLSAPRRSERKAFWTLVGLGWPSVSVITTGSFCLQPCSSSTLRRILVQNSTDFPKPPHARRWRSALLKTKQSTTERRARAHCHSPPFSLLLRDGALSISFPRFYSLHTSHSPAPCCFPLFPPPGPPLPVSTPEASFISTSWPLRLWSPRPLSGISRALFSCSDFFP